MMLSVFTVATPDLSPEQLLGVAREAGIHAIEWRCTHVSEAVKSEAPSFWGNNRCTLEPTASMEELRQLRAATEAHGLQSLAVVPYLKCGDLAETERMLSIAAELGAATIRIGVPGYDGTRPFGELMQEARAYVKEAEKLAKQYGVKELVETHHKTITPSASLARQLVDGCDPDAIGVLYDPGNLVHEGFESHKMGLEILGPYLAHVHVKNAAWVLRHSEVEEANRQLAAGLATASWSCEWKAISEGIVPWKQVLTDLKAVGYTGAFGVEDFSKTYDSSTMLRLFVEQMKTWWEEA
ncbi:Xylose isomerase domain protein TIM barrel [Paenibacillus curdlanolyticus YK9]|uniref:Xylose isomerase domain protein TIM barrel n=1 Tax=Paenibacillus curdlanolyticus YK9 TaxID=717606 RepID=E0IFN0_9BACL|nr:sugar phosphate isomerase/epimerase family protein [Paenibacillus curdlanolyticus]EFM08696.1 Xylose isomerase domain protein TIM barrel [Paenibacillus curdlanolyticus YK9]